MSVRRVVYGALCAAALVTLGWRAATVAGAQGSAAAAAAQPAGERHLLYAAVPGIRNYIEYGGVGVLVYDMTNGHRLVKRIPTFDPASDEAKENVKGIAADGSAGRLYVATIKRVVAIDVATEKIVWNRTYEGGADRLAISPDGKVLYVPSLEGPHWHAVDAKSGDILAKVVTNSGAHNTIYGADGKEVYLAGLKSPNLFVADPRSHTIAKTVGPFSSVIRPFTVNGAQTLCFVNVNELLGFEVGDLKTGKMLHRVEVAGYQKGPIKRHGCPSHGVGLTPDEKELWLADAANNSLHVFDATVMPPKQVTSIRLRDQPGWITFSLDGRYAYPSTGEVIETATRRIVASLSDENGREVHSEKVVEMVFRDGRPVRAGDQFGIGRRRAAAAAGAALVQQPQPANHTRASETALDRYVAAPDPAFQWKVLRELPAAGATSTLLEMTSQRWLTEKEVERPLWTHWITVVRPEKVTSDVALLFITGGNNQRQPPSQAPGWLLDAARDTGTVTAELRLVPNQPIVFVDDPTRKPRSEDDFIAYTWDKYLRTSDERWPARLPMTKSAVRAMDAVTAFVATPEGGGAKVERYVVSGASKRGWTAWTTAAVDRRIVAVAPAVIDMLNVEPSFVHHWRAYGEWSNAVRDYVEHGIMNWMGTREFRALMKIEEPYEYRQRLTMPKFILNASGDQFFLPDSSQFYFDELRGEKHVRYVPNAGHSMDKSDALENLHAFYTTVVKGTRRPEVRWTFERDGSIKVVTRERPDDVRVWQATNPKARNFRHDVIGSAYTSTPLAPSGPNTWVARVPPPSAGWTAFFVEMSFPSGGKYPFKVTSGVRVVPDTLPFPPPEPKRKTDGGR